MGVLRVQSAGNIKAFELAVRILPDDFSVRNDCRMRTPTNMDNEALDKVPVPLCQNLHASIWKVSDPTGQTELPGMMLHKVTEAYALHHPADHDVNAAFHLSRQPKGGRLSQISTPL